MHQLMAAGTWVIDKANLHIHILEMKAVLCYPFLLGTADGTFSGIEEWLCNCGSLHKQTSCTVFLTLYLFAQQILASLEFLPIKLANKFIPD